MGEQRTAFGLLLILCFAIAAISEIGTVKAEETIYIRADGSVSPETAPVQRNGDVYTLTGGMNHLIVERNNTIIDGNGMHLESDTGTETIIYLHNVRNVMVKNCVIGKSDFGIFLDLSQALQLLAI